MSTTTDEAVALAFAKEGDARTASTLVVASMGMIDRGATLDWLSQYPHEREILLPPLTAMEVVDIEDFVDSGAFQIRKLHVRLNTNMVSMTIENLLSVRKKQVSELAEIVARDMSNHDMAADIVKRTKKLRAAQAKVQLQPSEAFNTNQAFLSNIDQVKSLMPQTGDCIQKLYGHSRDVYGLVATDSGFASSSWNGTLRLWTLGDDSTYTNNNEIQLPSASLSLVVAGVGWVASSQFDGVVSMHSLSITDTNAAAIVEHRATAALESRLESRMAAFRRGGDIDIEGAEELTAEGWLGATKTLTHEGSSIAVVSLAVLSTASSPVRLDDVTVSVDVTPSLVPSAASAIWLACGSMDGTYNFTVGGWQRY